MKPQTPFKTLLLLALLLVAGGFSAKAQEDSCAVNVIHTYMNGRLVPWDSVEVQVCRSPCEGYAYQYYTFKLYWPDTILANCATRIDEYVAADKLELSQNYPNPCMGESSVKLTTRTAGSVRLQVMDVQGRLCCQRTETFPAGVHTLSLAFPHNGLYFVTAETAEGRETCKVLCSEGKGSSFGIRLSSTSHLVEKAEKGGEGLFNMTDALKITAYITHNDSVWSRYWLFNESYLNDSLYHHGSVNIHFCEYTGCDSFSLSGQTYNIIINSHACQPFTDYPIGGTVNFYDSTFFASPGIHFQQLSSTWTFDGWYKYRFYPNQNAQWGRMWICQMDKNLPPIDLEPTDYQTYTEYDIRGVYIFSCDFLDIGIATLFSGSTFLNEELMIKEE